MDILFSITPYLIEIIFSTILIVAVGGLVNILRGLLPPAFKDDRKQAMLFYVVLIAMSIVGFVMSWSLHERSYNFDNKWAILDFLYTTIPFCVGMVGLMFLVFGFFFLGHAIKNLLKKTTVEISPPTIINKPILNKRQSVFFSILIIVFSLFMIITSILAILGQIL